MPLGNIFMALMLIAFGASWPAQIIKTIRVKNPVGKSFVFQGLVISGYICGVIGTILKEQGLHWLVWIYLLDIALVSTDLILSLIYLKRLRAASNG